MSSAPKGRLTTLATQSLIYGLGSVASKVAAILMLPLYTHYLSRSDYGRVELILSLVTATAILTQLGLINSFFRFWFDDTSDEARKRVFQTVFWTLIISSTIGATLCLSLSYEIADLIFGSRSKADLVQIGAVGIWMQTNYQLMAALFRVQQRPVAFSVATLVNLAVTVGITVGLVVYADMRASGLLLGNFVGSLIVYVGLLGVQRKWLGIRKLVARKLLRELLAFGLPMVPAAAALWAVNLMNRPIINEMEGAAMLGIFAVAFKLSQGVMLIVQAFQLSWPAFAHSIEDDEDARRTYARVMYMYAAVLTWAVAGLGLLAPWLVRWFTNERFYDSIPLILPLAAGAALFGGFFIASIGVARVKKTQSNWVISLIAAGAELGLLMLLIPKYGVEGAAWAMFASYFIMFALMVRQSQKHFPVPYRWLKTLHPVAIGIALIAPGELLIATTGAPALAIRVAMLAAYPAILVLTGFLSASERKRVKTLVLRKS